jgi:hypothetical protein
MGVFDEREHESCRPLLFPLRHRTACASTPTPFGPRARRGETALPSPLQGEETVFPLLGGGLGWGSILNETFRLSPSRLHLRRNPQHRLQALLDIIVRRRPR